MTHRETFNHAGQTFVIVHDMVVISRIYAVARLEADVVSIDLIPMHGGEFCRIEAAFQSSQDEVVS